MVAALSALFALFVVRVLWEQGDAGLAEVVAVAYVCPVLLVALATAVGQGCRLLVRAAKGVCAAAYPHARSAAAGTSGALLVLWFASAPFAAALALAAGAGGWAWSVWWVRRHE